MFLKLKYFLKTNSTVRALDEFEYLDMCEKLNPLRQKFEECRAAITLSGKDSKHCFDNEYGVVVECPLFSTKYGCHVHLFGDICPSYPANQEYIRARDAYLPQKKIVDEFWQTRMTQRANAK